MTGTSVPVVPLELSHATRDQILINTKVPLEFTMLQLSTTSFGIVKGTC